MWEDIRFFLVFWKNPIIEIPPPKQHFFLLLRVLSSPMHRLAFVKMTTHLSFPGIIWGQQMLSVLCPYTLRSLCHLCAWKCLVWLYATARTCLFLEGYPQTPIIPFIWVYREMEIVWEFLFIKQCSTNDGWIQRFKHTNFPCVLALLGGIYTLSLSRYLLGRFAKFST